MCGRFRMKSVDSHMSHTKSVFKTYALSAKYTVEGAVFWARFASVLNPDGLQVPYEEKL